MEERLQLLFDDQRYTEITTPDERDEMKNLEADDAFRNLIAPLPEKSRRLLTMLYAHGLTQKEAAAKLGMSQQAAAVVKARALKALRKTIRPA